MNSFPELNKQAAVLSGKNKVPRTLFEARKVAGSVTYESN